MPSAPDNGSYMVAAYIVTAAIYVIYTVSLMVRTRRQMKKAVTSD